MKTFKKAIWIVEPIEENYFQSINAIMALKTLDAGASRTYSSLYKSVNRAHPRGTPFSCRHGKETKGFKLTLTAVNC